MKYLSTVLNKVFVREFYRANASFFLVVLGIAAGFMRSSDHLALAEFFISAPLFLPIPFAVWMFYAFKVINFVARTLKRSENEFLFHIVLVSTKEQVQVLLSAITTLLIPVILYGGFLLILALQHQLFLATTLTLLALLAITGWVTFNIYSALHRPEQEAKVSSFRRFIDKRFTKPYPLFIITWVSRREPLMLARTKLFSGLILLGFLKLYETDTYDLRLIGIGMAIAFSATSTLVMQIHQFENHHFALSRQLPIPFYKRVIYWLCVIIFFILPETGVLVSHFPAGFSVFDLAGCYWFALGLTMFFYGYLFLRDSTHEQFTTAVFFFVMVSVVLVLFSIPLWVLGMINFAAGLVFWRRFHYRFEYISKG